MRFFIEVTNKSQSTEYPGRANEIINIETFFPEISVFEPCCSGKAEGIKNKKNTQDLEDAHSYLT